MLERKPEAVCIGNHLAGFRARKGDEQGIAYIKNGKTSVFVSAEDFWKQMMNGPCIDLDAEEANKQR